MNTLKSMVAPLTKRFTKTPEEEEQENAKKKTQLNKIFYEMAAIEFIRTLCENIYTSENVNFKDRFNEIVIKTVIDSLNNDPKTIQQIRDSIFGSDNQPGMRKYIQDLFRISTCSQKKDEDIYPFTTRVLYKLFNDDTTIPIILSKTIFKMNNESVDLNSIGLMEKMLEEIENQLVIINTEGEKISGGDDEENNPTTQPPSDVVAVNQIPPLNISSFSDFTKNNAQLSENTTTVSQEIKEDIDMTTAANGSQKRLIDMMETNYTNGESFHSVIQDNIIKAIQKIMDKFKDELYEEVKKKVIDNYTGQFTDNFEIKLQILYSILSYNPDNENGNCCDNTFKVSYKIIEESIGKFLEVFKPKNRNDMTEDEILQLCSDKDLGIMHYLKQGLLTKQAAGNDFIRELNNQINTGGKSKKIRKSLKKRTKRGYLKKSRTKKSKTKKRM